MPAATQPEDKSPQQQPDAQDAGVSIQAGPVSVTSRSSWQLSLWIQLVGCVYASLYSRAAASPALGSVSRNHHTSTPEYHPAGVLMHEG